MSEESLKLSQVPPQRTSINYNFLREHGLEYVRQLAKETWTDHNTHDPGITLLEAFTYAMTELGFRIQLDLPDLVQSGIHHHQPDLEPAHRVLPCAPVTLQDLRKVLLDHPLIRDAQISTNAESEIRFFQLPDTHSPPFSYTQNASPANLSGLNEVVLEFRERKLNSNSYTLYVGPSETPYTLIIALPWWDEEEASPFRSAPAIDSVNMVIQADGFIWRPLEEEQTWFGEMEIHYGEGGAETAVLWVVLNIANELEDPASEIPLILNDASAAIAATDEDSLIIDFTQRARDANGAVQQIKHYLSDWRNLCEDPVEINVARVQEIAVNARIEVTGSTNLEDLLTDIFVSIDRLLAPALQFIGMEEMLANGIDVEALFDGPLLRSGFLQEESESLQDRKEIYSSDILRLIMQRRSSSGTDLVAQENPVGRDIVAVTDLALSNYINNRPITEGALNCLRLVDVARYRPRLSLAKSRIIFVRNEKEVPYNMQRVEESFIAKRLMDEESIVPTDPSLEWPIKQGDALPVEDYIPIQNDLPRVYGVGEARLPKSISTEHRSSVMQLKGYLLLFEQFLADLTAQLGNINRFFSASADEKATYFGKALFDLPDVQDLLVQFPRNAEDRTLFFADPENAYVRSLRQALEEREQFLDRRNRMLDHLLGRQSEEMVAYSQELHRYAQKELLEGIGNPASLSMRMQARRQAANARLIQNKAKFLESIPWLNSSRLLAMGNPLHWNSNILNVVQSDGNFQWSLSLEDQILLRSVNEFSTYVAATVAAEEVLILATQEGNYTTVIESGRWRYQLQDSSGLAVRIVAVSEHTFASTSSAQTAAEECAQQFTALRLNTSQSPLEQRLAHLCGIRSIGRRPLIRTLSEFFEIYDELDDDGIIEKRWRLWEYPERNGRVMLSSVFHFEGATDEEAETLAEESIFKVLRYGHNEWNYVVSAAGSETYNFDLRDNAGNIIGLRNPPLPSETAALEFIEETRAHLYNLYSAEGFHLVEHLLLRPRQIGDEFLSLPEGPENYEVDPYSQRLSLIFPSGWMRDFNSPEDPNLVPRYPAEPHRFRDPEFRRHVEHMLQQACPAHLLPKIYWVDRKSTAVETPEGLFSFDDFEQRFFAWLHTILIPGSTSEEINSARNALVLALNGIANV